jgi:CO/xanthine dehydrogenase Mo-binding subunit
VRAEEVEYCAEKFSLKSDPSQVPLRERRARGRAAVTVNEDFPPPDDDATRAQVAEVEVDRETGRARLRASLTAHDVGRSSIRSRTRASRRRSSAGMGQS